MREGLELETLEERRLSLHLILMYKVVEGLVPALPTYNFVKLARWVPDGSFIFHDLSY
jgi:hypothetical protein